jgi:hypothetical protein
MIRKLSFLLVQTAAAISPAFAEMPNPHVERWTDHQHMVIGSDLEPQHYATAEISAPDSGGVVTVVITCENGTRGSSWAGYFALAFRQGDNVLASTVEHCQLSRGKSEYNHMKYSRNVKIDLSKVICRVDNVQTSITAAPTAIKPLPMTDPLCSASASLDAANRTGARASPATTAGRSTSTPTDEENARRLARARAEQQPEANLHHAVIFRHRYAGCSVIRHIALESHARSGCAAFQNDATGLKH